VNKTPQKIYGTFDPPDLAMTKTPDMQSSRKSAGRPSRTIGLGQACVVEETFTRNKKQRKNSPGLVRYQQLPLNQTIPHLKSAMSPHIT
jgi:hypothetical protein